MSDPPDAEPPTPSPAPEPGKAAADRPPARPVAAAAAPPAREPAEEDTIVTETDAFDQQLVAEIRILVDFISGRGDKNLGAGAQGKLPSDCRTYADGLAEFFRICAASRVAKS